MKSYSVITNFTFQGDTSHSKEFINVPAQLREARRLFGSFMNKTWLLNTTGEILWKPRRHGKQPQPSALDQRGTVSLEIIIDCYYEYVETGLISRDSLSDTNINQP